MLPLLFALLGAALVAAGVAILRGFGPRYRVGRLLSAAPPRTIAEAVAFAREGRADYVRVEGRIGSREIFPDEHDRPLVFRRRRLELAGRGGWRVLHESREAVPFGLEDRDAFVAIDAAALDEGLVVLPREASGTAADLADGSVPGADPATPARQRIDQVSAVEHAVAAGVPRLDAGGEPTLGAGLGRPLILTTLELDAAMRVLAEGQAGRLRAAAIILAVGLGLLGTGVLGGLLAALRV